MAKSKNSSVMDKMASYMNINKTDEIKSIVNAENEKKKEEKELKKSLQQESVIEERITNNPFSITSDTPEKEPEEENKKFRISNTRSAYDTLFRTKNYDMFIPYPKEELRLPLHTGAKFAELRDSLVKYGMNTPIKVIKAETSEFGGEEGKLIVLGGHNRLEIAKEYGLEVLYYILPITETSQTDIIMAEEVLLNRQIDELLPTQIYNLLKAMYSNGNSIRQISNKLDGNKSLALGKSSISNYLKIENLTTAFRHWVDENRLPVRQVATFAKIKFVNQKQIEEYCSKNDITKITAGQIEELANLEEFGDEQLDKVFVKRKRAEGPKSFKVDLDDIKDLIPQEDMSKAKEIVRAALKMFYESKQ